MDGDEKVVFSAGNSWIVCRSKSHSGRIYYFNTLTGEAAWNLSDAEIEKAKHRTNNLAKQNSINIQECPEPKEPPMEQSKEITPPNTQQNQASPAHSQIYNKQIINNKFTKEAYPITPVIVPSYSHLLANPINAIMPVAMNASNAGYNGNIWTVPPTHQIYIAPTISPLGNQSQASMNLAYNNDNQLHTVTVQSTKTSLSGRFQNLQNTRFNNAPRKQFQRRSSYTPNKFRQKNDGFHINFKKNLVPNDLRKVLSAKRQRRVSCNSENDENEGFKVESETWSDVGEQSAYESEYEEEIMNLTEEPKPTHSKIPHKENKQNDADSDWLEENILVEDRRLKLDISNLKKLAKPDMDPECWYLVADKDILLYHLNFLNILCNSDDACLLMVGQQVMAELREESRGGAGGGGGGGEPRNAARAKRAVSFLLQQLDAGYVVVGDANCGESDTRRDYLLNCCSNLYEQNYHVVLLSNDDDFIAYKNSTNVPIFNIKELKQFLTKSGLDNVPNRLKTPPPCKTPECKKPDRLKPPPCATKTVPHCTNKAIKITVANDLHREVDKNMASYKVTKGTQFNNDVASSVEKNIETVAVENIVIRDLNNSLSIKCTTEVGVQTDLQNQAPASEECRYENFEIISEPQKETHINTNDEEKNATSRSAKREIRLNRSISAKTTASTEDTAVVKKQFKWRRRRHISNTTTNSLKISSANNSSNVDENRDSLNTQRNDKMVAPCEQIISRDKSEESISSETSSFIITRNLTYGTFTVEETSTSGIISNSTSNVDSGSESGSKCDKLKSKPTGSQKSVMIKITDQKMEDCLRTRTDEWVSRFVQIMEEVLTQVLRKDENFLNDVVYKLHGGGPWTIREAADCIKIKYSNNSDIVDAASKLAAIFMKISDHTGRITCNLRPSEYMEMYSFGVYLIESLQSVLNNCEDLETAIQCLLRLLDDIQNPNFDSSHNETFDAHPQDEVPCVDISYMQSPKTMNKPEEQVTPIKQITRRDERITEINSSSKGSPYGRKEIDRSNNGSPYNLRSKNRSTSQDDNNTDETVDKNNAKVKENNIIGIKDKNGDKNKNEVTFIRNIDIKNSFFTSLNLVKKPGVNTPQHSKLMSPSKSVPCPPSKIVPSSPQKVVTPMSNSLIKTVSNVPAEASNSQHLIRSIFDRNLEPRNSVTESKIIRKFTVFPENENNSNKTIEREPLDMDQLDYSAMHDDDVMVNDEYYSNGECYENEDESKVNGAEERKDGPNLNDEEVLPEEYPAIETDDNAYFKICDDKFVCDSPLSVNNNLNYIFSTIIRRVKEGLLKVQNFCKDTYKELSEPQLQTMRRKYEMNENAERAQVLLDNLCKSLNKIYCRETYEPDKNIQSILKNAGINDFDLNENNLKLYRDAIGQCLEQAQILQESIALIKTVIKKKPIV